MSADSWSNKSLLSLAMLRKNDSLCDRFEAEWKAGRRPEIARYIEEVSVEARPGEDWGEDWGHRHSPHENDGVPNPPRSRPSNASWLVFARPGRRRSSVEHRVRVCEDLVVSRPVAGD
jgi:hypothetical protein